MRLNTSLALPNSATTPTAAFDVGSYGSASFLVNTTGVLTIGAEGSLDGVTWYAFHIKSGAAYTIAAAAAGNRALVVDTNGIPKIRLTFANSSGGALAATVDAFKALISGR